MDPYEIEDTSDWEGCPTRLETVKHYASMLEEDIQALNRDLRKAREDISGLVQMHADVSKERDQLRAELARAWVEVSEARGQITEIETKINWELMSKDKVISEIHSKLRALTGKDPFTRFPRN